MRSVMTARLQGGQAPPTPQAGTLQPPPGCGHTTTSLLTAGDAWPLAIGRSTPTARGRGGQDPLANRVGTPHPPPGCSRATSLPRTTGSAWPISRRNAEVTSADSPSVSSINRGNGHIAAHVHDVKAVRQGPAHEVPVAKEHAAAPKVRKGHVAVGVHTVDDTEAQMDKDTSLSASTSGTAGAGPPGPRRGCGGGSNSARAQGGRPRPARPGVSSRHAPSSAVDVLIVAAAPRMSSSFTEHRILRASPPISASVVVIAFIARDCAPARSVRSCDSSVVSVEEVRRANRSQVDKGEGAANV